MKEFDFEAERAATRAELNRELMASLIELMTYFNERE
jgi:hypothetical protein